MRVAPATRVALLTRIGHCCFLEKQLRPRRRYFVVLGWWVLSLLVLIGTGCERSGGPMADERGLADASGEGYGHDRPPHKPEDLRDAVVEIKRRWEALEEGTPTAATIPDRDGPDRQVRDHRVHDREVHELEDILIWLPELAAETDLRRADWERVNSLSQELRRFVESSRNRWELGSSSRDVVSDATPGTHLSGWRDAWNQLSEIAGRVSDHQEQYEAQP